MILAEYLKKINAMNAKTLVSFEAFFSVYKKKNVFLSVLNNMLSLFFIFAILFFIIKYLPVDNFIPEITISVLVLSFGLMIIFQNRLIDTRMFSFIGLLSTLILSDFYQIWLFAFVLPWFFMVIFFIINEKMFFVLSFLFFVYELFYLVLEGISL